MKKITLAILGLFIIGFMANAQLRFGVKAGLNLSKWVYEDDDHDDIALSLGYHAGGVMLFELPMGLEIETGLLISQKGVTYKNFFLEGTTFTAMPMYMDLPLKLNYKVEIGPAQIFVGAGPVISYGIAGEYKTESDEGSNSVDIEWNDEENFLSLNRLDFGLGFQVGARITNIQVSGFYEMGLKPIFYDKSLDDVRNRVFGVSIVYFR